MDRVQLTRGTDFLPTEVLRDWTPVDTLTVVRLQHAVQSYDASDVNTSAIRQAVADRFEHADPMANPSAYARRRYFQDLFRFSPSTTTTTLPPLPGRGGGGGPVPALPSARLAPAIERLTLARALDFQRIVEARFAPFATRRSAAPTSGQPPPARRASHFALLASDPHVTLPSPSFFWGCHLRVTGDHPFDAAGSVVPGVPASWSGSRARWPGAQQTSLLDQVDRGPRPSPTDRPHRALIGRDVPIETVTENIPNGAGGTLTVDFGRRTPPRDHPPEHRQSPDRSADGDDGDLDAVDRQRGHPRARGPHRRAERAELRQAARHSGIRRSRRCTGPSPTPPETSRTPPLRGCPTARWARARTTP